MKKRVINCVGILLMIICGIVVTTAKEAFAEDIKDELIQEGYSSILSAPNINVVNGSSIELNGDYNFNMQLYGKSDYSDGTSYKPFGEYKKVPGFYHDTGTANPSATEVYHFKPSTSRMGVEIKHVGYHKGRELDAVFVIDELKLKNPDATFRFFAVAPEDVNETKKTPGSNRYVPWGTAFLMIGSGLYNHHFVNDEDLISGLFPFSLGDSFKYHYEFYDSETGAPVNVKGVWNYNNVNYVKKVYETNNLTDFSQYYVTNNSTVYYKELGGSEIVFKGSTDDMDTPETRLSKMFEAPRLDFEVEVDVEGRNTKENKTPLALMYSQESLVRISPSKPVVIGKKNETKHNELEYGELQYNIYLQTGGNSMDNRNTKLSITTEVPEEFSIEPQKIVNIIGGKVIPESDYTVITDPSNPSKVTIEINNPTEDMFNNGYFEIAISAKPNNKFQFSPNKYGYLNDATSSDNGYMHFELATSTSVEYKYKTSAGVEIDNTLYSEKVDEQSIAKVNYEGKPTGEPKTGLKLDVGKQITDIYPTAADLMQAGFESAIDTENLSKDTPVTAAFIGTLPDTSGKQEGDTVEVPIRLTSKLGVTKDVKAILTIEATDALLKVQFVNELGDVLSEVQLTEYKKGQEVILANVKRVQDELAKYKADGGYTVVNEPPAKFNITTTPMIVQYELKGNLYIASAPKLFDFGRVTKKLNDINIKEATNLSTQSALKVVDNRGDKSDGWTLTLKVVTELTSGSEQLVGAMEYRTSDKDGFVVNTSAETAFASQSGGDAVVSDTWKADGPGLGLKIKANSIKKTGTYGSEIEWGLIASAP